MRNLDERPLKGRGRIIPIVIYLKEKGKPRKCFSRNGNPTTRFPEMIAVGRASRYS
jgi:predicted deacylase